MDTENVKSADVPLASPTTVTLPIPLDAKTAQEWLLDENYLNSGHLSAIEHVAGKTIDQVWSDAGRNSSEKPAVLTNEQKAASERIKKAVTQKKKAAPTLDVMITKYSLDEKDTLCLMPSTIKGANRGVMIIAKEVVRNQIVCLYHGYQLKDGKYRNERDCDYVLNHVVGHTRPRHSAAVGQLINDVSRIDLSSITEIKKDAKNETQTMKQYVEFILKQTLEYTNTTRQCNVVSHNDFGTTLDNGDQIIPMIAVHAIDKSTKPIELFFHYGVFYWLTKSVLDHQPLSVEHTALLIARRCVRLTTLHYQKKEKQLTDEFIRSIKDLRKPGDNLNFLTSWVIISYLEATSVKMALCNHEFQHLLYDGHHDDLITKLVIKDDQNQTDNDLISKFPAYWKNFINL